MIHATVCKYQAVEVTTYYLLNNYSYNIHDIGHTPTGIELNSSVVTKPVVFFKCVAIHISSITYF